MSATPLTLQYESQKVTSLPRRAWRWTTLAAAALAMVVTVVPFAWEISPARAVIEGAAEYLQHGFSSGGFVDLAAVTAFGGVFFLAFPLFVWKIRRMLGRPEGRFERFAMLAAGGAGALAVVFVESRWLRNPSGSTSGGLASLSWGGTVFCFAAGILIVQVVRNRGVASTDDARITLAMIGPYLANLLICVIGFSSAREIGWYLSLAPGAVFMVELALVAREALRKAPSD
jgi:hypothetical protein